MTAKNDKTVLFIRILSVIGIVLASYLFYEYVFHPPFQPCSINSVINCDAVTKGAVSKTLGIPTALYGLVGYVSILLLSFTKKMKLLLGMATFGMLFCLRITIIELFVIHTYCPVCLTCQLDMLLLFFIAIKPALKKS